MPTLASSDPRVIYALFKGDPGTRKSTAALSFPKPQYWFSWDRKMQGILIPARNWKIDTSQISYDDYDDWNGPLKKLEQFQSNCPFSTLVFDSVTSCADMMLRQVMRIKKAGAPTDKGKVIGGIPVSGFEEFNAEASGLNELIALTKDIQAYHYRQGKIINIILIAHVMEVTKVEGTTQTVTRTIVTAGKRVSAKIPAYCSEVYHFHKEAEFDAEKEGKYSILTRGDNLDFARTALPLSTKIEMQDKPLYGTWIEPAIKKLQADPNKPQEF